jgi:hypothetical protein
LPYTYIYDIKKDTGGLTPADFHKHWYWERKSTLRPLLDPLQARKQYIGPVRIARTGRILSTGEELVRQPSICSAYHRQGHTISSRNCPLKLQASITTQSQILLEIDIIAARLVASTAPTAPVAPTAPTAPAAPAVPVSTASLIPKQLSPDRPEVLIQAYLAEKTA